MEPESGATVLIGLQYGDEGKGKITDFLAHFYDIVVRYQGGVNAGHTIYLDDKVVVLHQIPSGIFSSRCACAIGNGVVVDPEGLVEEIEMVEKLGYRVSGRLWISTNAHVVLPYHKALDIAEEETRTYHSIGTTRSGIGPVYVDKYSRDGIRMIDMIHETSFFAKLSASIKRKNEILHKLYQKPGVNLERTLETYKKIVSKLKPFIRNVQDYLHKEVKNGKKVLLEGAQGTMLDIDYGTYPFVTSSNPTFGGAIVGSGVPHSRVNRVLGITKSYTTRVGNGAFPTELKNHLGEKIKKIGKEIGATTGRERRVGWLDIKALQYAIDVNGITDLAMMKLDVLDSLDEIKVCTGYKIEESMVSVFPSDNTSMEKVSPQYKVFKGWHASNSKAKTYQDLHRETRRYLEFIEDSVKTKIAFISIGPGKHDTIVV